MSEDPDRDLRDAVKERLKAGGRIVHEPTVDYRHQCSPPESPDSAVRPNWVSMNVLTFSGHGFTHTSEFESGTVWRCDECGTTWRSGRGLWSPEGRFARWRRERRLRRDRDRARRAQVEAARSGGTVVLDQVNAPADVLPPSAAIVTKGGAKPPNSPTPPRGSRKPPPPPPRGSG